MADIQNLLQQLLTAIYGKDVRQAIVDAIKQCYNDASTGLIPEVKTKRVTNGIQITITVGVKTESFVIEDAYNPVRGTDYWTDEDIAVINDEVYTMVLEETAKRGQLKPEFATFLKDCTDKTKVYVLPDGYIYANVKEETIVTKDPEPKFTNLKNECTFKYGYRYSVSGGSYKVADGYTGIVIPVPSGITKVTIRLKNTPENSNYTAFNHGSSQDSFIACEENTAIASGWSNYLDEDGVYTFTITKDSSSAYISTTLVGTGESDFEDLIVTVDEPIEYTEVTETVVTESFQNTGLAFVPADYEDRVIELEKQNEILGAEMELMKSSMDEVKNKIGTVDENALVHNAVGTTFPPSQRPAQAEFDGYDIDVMSATSDDIHAYIDAVVSGKNTVTKEILGRDSSNNYDMARYTFANREYYAWQRQNYPKMYAWKNGSIIIYSESISPRIGDTMYSTTYVGTVHGIVTEVNATNRSRTIAGIEYIRYEEADVKPSLIYTDKDDERNIDDSIKYDGFVYNRYPLGDLKANKKNFIPIFIYANEHGVELAGLDENSDRYQKYETKMCALVASRFIRDLCLGKQSENPLFKYIRDNCMLIIIPVANPFGYNMNVTGIVNTSKNGYTNVNNCNINRNYDCPGWDVMNPNGSGGAYFGSYAGSENETQYIMNTMMESGAVVAMSLHGLGGWSGYCAHQGQSPDGSDYDRDKLSKVNTFLTNSYGYSLRYYDLNVNGTPAVAVNTPDITCKSPSYITQCGAYGGIVEFQPDDVNTSGFMQEMKSNVIENAYAQTLNLLAMWLSDYLEN